MIVDLIDTHRAHGDNIDHDFFKELGDSSRELLYIRWTCEYGDITRPDGSCGGLHNPVAIIHGGSTRQRAKVKEYCLSHGAFVIMS